MAIEIYWATRSLTSAEVAKGEIIDNRAVNNIDS